MNNFTFCVLTRTFYYQKNKKQWSSASINSFLRTFIERCSLWSVYRTSSLNRNGSAAVFHRTIVRSFRPSVFWVTRNRGSLSSVRSRSLVGNLWDRNFLLQIAASSVRCIPANPGQKNARPF